MKKKLKIFIIAGEVSGDVLGAKIMRELPDAQFAGVGGENMRGAGLKSLFPISDLAVMGLFEVLAKAKTLTSRISDTVNAIIKFQPDIVLTIDSPSFATRVIKKVKDFKSVSIPKFYHVVAPQVWAWGASRAEKYANIFDKLYCFFDFEKPYFEKYGLETISVGHPIADALPTENRNMEPGTSKQFTFLPGSRMGEVRRLLPIFKDVIEKLAIEKISKFYIPVVETTKKYIENEIKNWKIKPVIVAASQRYKTFQKTYIAIAASGTVSVELAILCTPTIIVYKMNPITTFLARFFIKTKWVTLLNILMRKTIFPELLGSKCTSKNILKEIKKMEQPNVMKNMRMSLYAMRYGSPLEVSQYAGTTGKVETWIKYKKSPAKLIAADILGDKEYSKPDKSIARKYKQTIKNS